MIEIYDIQDEKKPLDITPELAVMAARVVKTYCEITECDKCVFEQNKSVCGRLDYPVCWELPERG